MVSKYVLAGGPGSGKSKSIFSLQKSLSEKGYKVYVVQETARKLIESGLERNNPDFNIPILRRNIDAKKIEASYLKFKEDTKSLFRLTESYFIANNQNMTIIRASEAKKVFDYISTFGRSIEIPFGQPNKYSTEIRQVFLNKIAFSYWNDKFFVV